TLTSINQTLRGDFRLSPLPAGTNITGYTFFVKNLSTGAEREVVTSNYIFQLGFSDIAQYATTYEIQVAIRINQQWMPYGPICLVTTPGLPTTTLANSSCGAQLVSMNNIIRAVGVQSAAQYEYEIALIEDEAVVATTSVFTNGPSFNLTLITDPTFPIKLGAEYRVRVKAEVPTPSGLQWSPNFGAACSVFSP
ncbi:hypothetical protein, partial [Flavobacterium orientale]|uniref:hypothetical protein n=1 Tax=Flavobacterium orientale TaxID=1756020 RepID=UPI001669E4E6